MPTVSIIIPVYNVENSLEKCVNSVLNQNFSDYEVILVDDGSTDAGGSKCDEFQKEDSRVTVIHKENGGLASARNAGLSIAKGEFILFLDSDDYVTEDWCSHMMACTDERKENFIFGGIVRHFATSGKEKISNLFPEKTENIALSEFIPLHKQSAVGYAWNGMYYKDVLDRFHIRFPEECIVEDLPFVIQYLYHMKSMSYTGFADNHYMIDDRETLSRKYTRDAFRRYREKYEAVQEFVDEKLSGDAGFKRQTADIYLYDFLYSLNNTFDKRNTDSLFEKLSYNNKVVKSDAFQECLRLSDTSKENPVLISLLKNKHYYLSYFYTMLSNLK